MRIFTFFVPVILAFAVTVASAAEAPIAHVKKVSGEASLERGGESVTAAVGTKVHQTDVLKTGADGKLGVTFRDNTMISLGPDTEVAVTEFTYQPRRNKLRFATSMSRGTAQFVSGVIAKLAPEQVTVDTPAGTVGVRGTRFLVKVGP